MSNFLRGFHAGFAIPVLWMMAGFIAAVWLATWVLHLTALNAAKATLWMMRHVGDAAEATYRVMENWR